MFTTLPNVLTFSRILAIPALVATFYWPGHTSNWVALAIFVVAGLTDFFDGWLARRWRIVSNFGRFLDPIADKLLVAAALLMLVAYDRITGLSLLAAIVILCREILVAGLREFLAELRVRVPVSRLAKWKTTAQIVALCFLLVFDAAPAAWMIPDIGRYLLWIAALLTLVTGYDYLRAGLRHMSLAPEPAPRAERGPERILPADRPAAPR
jgi:cardiolipin synthase